MRPSETAPVAGCHFNFAHPVTFQPCADKWYRTRTADARGATRKTMIVALARKLLVALWKLATTGEVPQGVLLRSAIPATV